ncbi:DUF2141 domain-containing protein [Sphingomonas xinjiangensis]|uniref:Uncharacterized protein (DUF2141 family) n=1 Tax=Sphingomonas xinjiangensis TaxID=643568 RepID=A0A840YS05_9SPHN|nr:DUF2141 domain-containing protein [Sphingomonas xinjiangensis]MBB5712458.1 uncharacterized protein (DUF2141 family) [Sphingomonas xinjiangensis]
MFHLFMYLGTASVSHAVAAAATTYAQQDGSCSNASGPPLHVKVVGLKDLSGRLKLEIFPPTEADFLKDDRKLKAEGRSFRRVWSGSPPGRDAALCIRAPGPGTWAVLFTHDRDGKNKFNPWRDGAGLPSNHPLGLTRPKVKPALVTIPAGGMSIEIRAQYLKGLNGFQPL